MNQALNKNIFSFVLLVILPFVIAKFIWSVSLFFLEKETISKVEKENFSYHYNINLANKIIPSIKKDSKPVEIKDVAKINHLKLKGTYLSGDSGFIVVEDKGNTVFINKDEKYNGYTLIQITDKRAIFEKSGKNYEIIIEESKSLGSFRDEIPKDMIHDPDMPPIEEMPPGMEEESSLLHEPVTVAKKELMGFTKDPGKIWKGIRIQEIRREGKIDGFRVTYIKDKSFFDKIGLKRGDIIKGIDGKEITNMADVMKYYNNTQDLDALTLTVMRAEEEIELFFNIN